MGVCSERGPWNLATEYTYEQTEATDRGADLSPKANDAGVIPAPVTVAQPMYNYFIDQR